MCVGINFSNHRDYYCINSRPTQFLHDPLLGAHTGQLSFHPGNHCIYTPAIPVLPGLPSPTSKITSFFSRASSVSVGEKGQSLNAQSVVQNGFCVYAYVHMYGGYMGKTSPYLFMITKREIISDDFMCPGPRYVNS